MLYKTLKIGKFVSAYVSKEFFMLKWNFCQYLSPCYGSLLIITNWQYVKSQE